MNAISQETQEEFGPATVGGLAKPAFDGAIRLSQRATMNAAVRDRYGAPDLLYIREIPRPQPAADEVLVRVRASSVNSADWRIMRGKPLFARPMFGGILRPAAGPLGSDVAGVVEEVGNEVTDLRPGDEVFGNADGAFAEYVTGRTFMPKPANLSFAEAAAMPLAACTALQALRDKGGVRAGQQVLVTGAGGGVGTFAVQLAKAFGAHVTAVSRTDNLDMLRAIGADAVIDYTREDFTRSGRQFDLIVDVSATVSLRTIRRAMSPDGTLVIVGAGKDVLRRMAAASFRSRLLGQRMVVFVSSVLKPDLATLKKLAQENKLRPVIDTAFRLDETVAALRHVETGRTRGKVVVTVGG